RARRRRPGTGARKEADGEGEGRPGQASRDPLSMALPAAADRNRFLLDPSLQITIAYATGSSVATGSMSRRRVQKRSTYKGTWGPFPTCLLAGTLETSPPFPLAGSYSEPQESPKITIDKGKG